MFKNFLLTLTCVFVALGASAQGEFSAGVSLGLPIGDAGDLANFQVGLDANYLWEIADNIDVGVATGFINSFTKEIDILGISIDPDNVQFLPLAAAGRIEITEEFFGGADLGYAVGLNDGNDGGFYYRPMVGYEITDNIGLNLSYQGVSVDGGSWDALMLGAMYHFGD